ncbi:MAG: hypothetical protein C0P77_005435 [Thermoanaerobacterales bacterium]|jgi:SAM-dependent methyltransferase|nr:hypothetical protein [Thermoanaerobacterales bacterium]
MRSFDLGRRFDAVTCLFRSIGYMPTVEDLSAAVATMARHLVDGGVLVVDGWVRPDAWRDPGTVQALAGGAGDLAAARVVRSRRTGDRTILVMHILVATPDRVEHLVETHELTLFADEGYRAAFAGAGLTVEVHPSPHPDRDRDVGLRRR